MVVGTSTGGLVALALSCPDAEGKPRHTARDIVRLYEIEGKRVFSRSVWHKIRSVGALAEGKYPSAGIEGVLQDYFGECRLKDALADVVVPAYEIERRIPFFFKTVNARQKSYYDYPMRSVIRAATAAPTYFEPMQVQIDGPNDYYEIALKQVVAQGLARMKALVAPERSWYEIDDQRDLAAAATLFAPTVLGSARKV